jgi:hypothetical protein
MTNIFREWRVELETELVETAADRDRCLLQKDEADKAAAAAHAALLAVEIVTDQLQQQIEADAVHEAGGRAVLRPTPAPLAQGLRLRVDEIRERARSTKTAASSAGRELDRANVQIADIRNAIGQIDRMSSPSADEKVA